jgi:hypothetical protein
VVRQGRFLCVSFDELGAAYGLYFLDVLQSIFATDIAWTALCRQWGNPVALVHTTWAFSMNPIVIGIGEWRAVLCIERSDLYVSRFFPCRSCRLGTNLFRVASMGCGTFISLEGGHCGDCRGAYIYGADLADVISRFLPGCFDPGRRSFCSDHHSTFAAYDPRFMEFRPSALSSLCRLMTSAKPTGSIRWSR